MCTAMSDEEFLNSRRLSSAVTEFAAEVKQLCEDFSGRDGAVYIRDVHAAIDALLSRFLEQPTKP